MMSTSRTLVATAVMAGLSLPLSVYATNGMNSEGTGVKSRGMGGAGLALATETGSIVNNPAAVTGVGGRLDAALGLFDPSPRQYELSGGNLFGLDADQESDDKIFPIPFVGYSQPIDDKSAWSLIMSANGGMNTEYANNFAAGPFPGLTTKTGINLEQLFVNLTYGRKVGNIAYGVTGILAYARFEATGLELFQDPNVTSDPNNITNNGVDTSTGVGIKLGVSSDLGDGITLGASFQPEIDMSEFDNYKGLFADKGDMNIAPTYAIGLGWKVNPQLTVAFDYHFIDYEAVGSIGNSKEKFTEQGKLFGSDGGPGFGWKSINVFKLGFDYQMSDDLALRAGWNHGDNPISPEQVSVNFLAPGVIEDHLTLGFTKMIDKDSEFSMNYVHSFKNEVTGDFAGAFGGGEMTIGMEQTFIEFGYSRKM